MNSQIRISCAGRRRPQKEWRLLLLVSPFVIWHFVFAYLPLAGWAYAFVDFRLGQKLADMKYVGLDNFKMLFAGFSRFPRALRNTIVPNLIRYAFCWCPMAFALLLNELRRTWIRKGVQTVTTIPNFISWVMIYGMMIGLFSNDGAVNQWLLKLNVVSKTYNPLIDNNIAWTLQQALGMWKGLGYGAIIYLAAIAGVDQELYDAAMIDGAGRFRCAVHVTVPALMPVFMIQLVLDISNFFSSGMDYPLIFGNTMVISKLENLALYSYNIFKDARYSMGIALGIMNALVALILLFFANRLSKRVRGDGFM